MAEREWISQEKMFWTKQEWDEAYTSVSQNLDFNNLKATDRISKLIGYLMNEYPVSLTQLKEAKAKHGR
ncbi:hypothetical protein IMX26_09495 [Clostridium sp. 'deep sea']|uniref:hypothetical protein n=1 Tax=Clostridium sp. 'deep sea' TaxID=2779445 RepID=UPI0018966BB6|nr:hypothetical protein [Clostridium sp. 'deep sea']QOR33735.1 hypothetical protein IMX26_09495 [Clostridium sp. 'deep sea']